jgi:hypothetical protein
MAGKLVVRLYPAGTHGPQQRNYPPSTENSKWPRKGRLKPKMGQKLPYLGHRVVQQGLGPEFYSIWAKNRVRSSLLVVVNEIGQYYPQ